ncbi:triose-phosphate isomerase [Nesterenkonia aurantiaca]|uniref:Triosephosphate isomerase n=1 Tax=Nesterenkonia aurantiaca TaxID=1436010 RepID=A0A4R7G7X3_9MICC|nr:triose-phosphate isomerase [Nesterenkonia aurantiaca]TDS87723.1 triosephosphate isomerase [Nesterenkonia aurantiaca]
MTRWIGTSFKMNKTLSEARAYAAGLSSALQERPELLHGVQPFIIPPHTALAAVAAELTAQSAPGEPDVPGRGSVVRLGAQNAHWEDDGAWTGEISVPQVADAGAELVEIGHSERREHFGETIETTRLKVASVLRHGLVPLLCIGEPAQVQERGETAAYILEQARGALRGLPADQLSRVLIAYEPIWAIGAQGRPATAAELREPFEVLSREYAGKVQALLYGGSVSPENALEMLLIPGVQGLFVGRAAWTLQGYLEILRIASTAEKPHVSGLG